MTSYGNIKMIKIASEIQILSFFKQVYGNHQHKYFGFYNSQFNQVIIDEKYMLLPIDDRTATRAHGVFDVIYLKNHRLLNLDHHINRLLKSAESASIQPPFSLQQTRQIVVDVVQKVVDFHLRNDTEGRNRKVIDNSLAVRLTISSGFGDFGVASLGKKSILYIVIFEPYISEGLVMQGVKEYITKIVDKPNELVHAKTINYIDNAVMANLAKQKGGYQGIKALKNGVLLEAASANIGFVFGKQFATPRLQTVIEGTTIKKSLTFIQQLVDEGSLEKISFRDITIEEGEGADEMIVFGGDKVVPVLSFNDHQIGTKKGPITQRIQNWYLSVIGEGTPIRIDKQLL